MPRDLRPDPVHPLRTALARHAELQHVHLTQAQEQEAAPLPRGDLGRGRRVHPRPRRRPPRRPRALARAPPLTHGSQGETLIDWLVLVKCDRPIRIVQIYVYSTRSRLAFGWIYVREISEYMCC